MASIYPIGAEGRARLHGSLADPAFAIGGPRFDALLLWGCPLLAALLVGLWLNLAAALPAALSQSAVGALAIAIVVLTFAHLIAVVPRAYLNREVFETNRLRLTIVPLVLIAALLASPTLLVCGAVVAIFWDVHHSAMQTFGLARIYDMKAGNPPLQLRRTDLRLNWILYVGPIAAGASLAAHLAAFDRFGDIGWTALTTIPSLAEGHIVAIRATAVAAILAILGWAALDYRAAIARGYRIPAHKAALIGSTALVSIAAWGFAPPFVAFATINCFHAVQYFALVWLKEGGRMQAKSARLTGRRGIVLALFLLACAGFGIAYQVWQDWRWLAGPFVACSLLHFWYDSFVWSVRKKQV
jgi:hypothetical protein